MRRELGSAFIHLWLSQNHKDIAKNLIFNRILSHSFQEELHLHYLRCMSKGSMGIRFLYKNSQRIPRVSHLGQGAGEHGCYLNCDNFPYIPLRPLKHVPPLSTCHYWLMPERQLFPWRLTARGRLRDCKVQLSESHNTTSPSLLAGLWRWQPAQAVWRKRPSAVNPCSTFRYILLTFLPLWLEISPSML